MPNLSETNEQQERSTILAGGATEEGNEETVIIDGTTGDQSQAVTITVVPEALRLLCQDLLRRDPITRPAGAEIIRRLSALAGGQTITAQTGKARVRESVFLGRERQLMALEEAFERVRQGNAATVFINIEAHHLKARAALAAAGLSDAPARLLAEAENAAGKMEKEQIGYGDALARLVRASAAAARKQPALAIKLFAQAEEELLAADMKLYAAVARRRRGQLLGGESGNELMAAADEWMRAQQIDNPAQFTHRLAPGRF